MKIGMLRSAALADLASVASWINSARDCELWAGRRVQFPIDVELLPRAIEFEETNAFSLFENGQLIGFGQLLSKGAKRCHLARIIVSPAARGRGHGKVLVKALLEKASTLGYSHVSLYVDLLNPAATALYSGLGFHDAVAPADPPRSPDSKYMVKAI